MSYSPPSSWDVYRWPEFIAFAKRLGIHLEDLTLDLTIELPHESTVIITQRCRGEDMYNGGIEDREQREKNIDNWFSIPQPENPDV